jgi:hypothetical protein
MHRHAMFFMLRYNITLMEIKKEGEVGQISQTIGFG